MEFLRIFDGPNVTECYERRPSVVPQQALALANSELALAEARALTRRLSTKAGVDASSFVVQAFEQVLARRPRSEEVRLCADFLAQQAGQSEPITSSKVTPISMKANPQGMPSDSSARSRENLILVLMNHSDFVTVR